MWRAVCVENLRCLPARGAADPGHAPVTDHTGMAEVGDDDAVARRGRGGAKDVLELQVPVDESFGVHVARAGHDLSDQPSNLDLAHGGAAALSKREQVSAGGKIFEDVEGRAALVSASEGSQIRLDIVRESLGVCRLRRDHLHAQSGF